MNKQKAILILLLILPLLFVLYLYSPFLLMGLIDSFWYYTEEKVDIGPFDYSSVLTKAKKLVMRWKAPVPGQEVFRALIPVMSRKSGKVSEGLLVCRI